ncbi:MAG: hypothetical protein ABW046_01340 [Actinoplanes sp.]
MTAVARVLPREWDGRRLLRFLTGLALLALAFTAHVEPPTRPAPPAVVTVVEARAEARVEVEPRAEKSQPVTLPVALGITSVLVLFAAALRVRAQRAPPTV